MFTIYIIIIIIVLLIYLFESTFDGEEIFQQKNICQKYIRSSLNLWSKTAHVSWWRLPAHV